MTFNIRYDEPADGPRSWAHRRHLVIETIRAHEPDLIGLQEPSAAQFDEIAGALSGYSAFGVYRDEWGGVEPYGGFVRTERLDMRGSGLFWLSDTPDVAHSVSWANDWGPRACAWVRLRDRSTDRDLVFACTHVDTNADSWLPSAKVLHRELDRVARQSALVLVGDFNCSAGSDAHRYLVNDAGFRDAWHEAGCDDASVVTYHGFTGATRLPETVAGDERSSTRVFPADALALHNYRIDWILVRGPLVCLTTAIDDRRDRDLLPSDHYPVVADLEWSNLRPRLTV